MENKHIPVLIKEALDSLKIHPNGIYVDMTLGGGGYSLEILNKEPEIKLVSFDFDLKALEKYIKMLGNSNMNIDSEIVEFSENQILVNRNFSRIKETLSTLKISCVDGIIADLGWSTNQLETIEGLSFERGGDTLDMRFDRSLGVRALDLLNALGKSELNKIFMTYADFNIGEANILSRQIIETRQFKKFEKVRDLTDIIDKTFRSFNSRAGKNLMQTRARVFQSLRISVNSEYENLEEMIKDGFECLCNGGVISIVTFHSGEEKVLLPFIESNKDILEYSITKPTTEEILVNDKSRSAKLWVIKKNEH